MTDYGIRVSKPGFDVKTCDTKELSFGSEENVLKIFKTGLLTLEFLNPVPDYVTEDSISVTVTHELGYIPFILGFYLAPDGNWYPMSQDYDEDAVGDEWPVVFYMENLTTTQVTFTGWFQYGHENVDKYYLRYFILMERFT